MASEKTILYFGTGQALSSELLDEFAHEHGLAVEIAHSADDVRAMLNRTFPAGTDPLIHATTIT